MDSVLRYGASDNSGSPKITHTVKTYRRLCSPSFYMNMEAPYRECPMCLEESVQTDDAVLHYNRQEIVECENCHCKLEVNYDGEWNGSWHDLTTIRPLLALPFGESPVQFYIGNPNAYFKVYESQT